MAKRNSTLEQLNGTNCRRQIWQALMVALLVSSWVCPGGTDALSEHSSAWDELTTLSLEELMGIEVTLASRKEEKLFETAAAIWVITREDLRRSGVTSIPEALRLVPGMQVGRIDASKWGISIRGFADRFAQKLLVLIDGRSVYNPLFAGVYWEVQDLLLEDVAQIEVIRGPGATLWGANAVNGIVNIITRSARDTQGSLVTVGAGTEERGFGGVRYGGMLGEEGHYRIYAKAFSRDSFVDATGKPGNDDWQMARSGFRGDWQLGEKSELTVQGDLFTGDVGQTLRFPLLEPPFGRLIVDDTGMSGRNLLGRWQRSLERSGDLQLQLYCEQYARVDSLGDWDYAIYDIDFQHRFSWRARQEIVWGAGYRLSRDETGASVKFHFDPASDSAHLVSAFAQDEITLADNRLHLILGSKFEHNPYSGFEYQPNARLLWKPRTWQTVWLSATRAVRTPARADVDVRLNVATFPTAEVLPSAPSDAPPAVAVILGDRSLGAEKLFSLEAGYRFSPASAFFVDLAVFYNDYDDLRAGRAVLPYLDESADPPRFVFELPAANLMKGRTRGGELAVDWQLPERLGRLRAAYTFLDLDLDLDASANIESKFLESGSPSHQFFIWAALNPRSDLQVDGIVRFTGGLPKRTDQQQLPYVERLPDRGVDRYGELDLRLAWRPKRGLELAVVGQNLLADQHREAVDTLLDTQSTRVQRGVYGAITWGF
jgi:iron complex outermembrane recepter protein